MASAATTEESPLSFGQRLRWLRERAGMSQEDLAEQAGLSVDAVSSLERGARTHPYPATVRALAAALNLPPSEHAALTAAVPRRDRTGPRRKNRLSTGPARLPVPPTPLLGREHDLEAVARLLAQPYQRLVTLTGMGGIGKSRLAIAVAQKTASEMRDGAVFVALAPVLDDSLVLAEIGRSVGVIGAERLGGSDRVVTALAPLQMLLVLDNLEHLSGAGLVVADLLARCPDLTVLVTSRAPMRIRGEAEYQVPPLALPEDTIPDPASLAESPAAALFLARGRAIRPDFDLGPEDVSAVVRICRCLAGLPLALELAAAGLRTLNPEALLGRLDEVLDQPGELDLPARQHTLRATLDWSHALLMAQDREVFRRLGVFVGGFSLEAAEAVVGQTALAAIGRLTTHSLCVATPTKGQPRYVMLEPVATYARSLLTATEFASVQRAHAEFFVSLAEMATAGYRGDHQHEWLRRLDEESGNLSAAFQWAIRRRAGDLAGRLADALWMYWWMRGQQRWARPLIEQALALDMSEPIRARALIAAGGIAEPGVDTAHVEQRYAEALDLARRGGDHAAEASAALALGGTALEGRNFDVAEQRLSRALTAAKRAGADGEWYASHARILLGAVSRFRGDPAGAVKHIEAGLESARERGDGVARTIALYNLAQSVLALGRPRDAEDALLEAVRVCRVLADAPNLSLVLDGLAGAVAATAAPERVASLLGAAESLRRMVGSAGYGFYAPDFELRQRTALDARRAVGEDRYLRAFELGHSLDFDGAAALALEHTHESGP